MYVSPLVGDLHATCHVSENRVAAAICSSHAYSYQRVVAMFSHEYFYQLPFYFFSLPVQLMRAHRPPHTHTQHIAAVLKRNHIELTRLHIRVTRA